MRSSSSGGNLSNLARPDQSEQQMIRTVIGMGFDQDVVMQVFDCCCVTLLRGLDAVRQVWQSTRPQNSELLANAVLAMLQQVHTPGK